MSYYRPDEERLPCRGILANPATQDASPHPPGIQQSLGKVQRPNLTIDASYASEYYFLRFEDTMRSERERRNEGRWNFFDYFLLQEELAFAYEMLGVYDEALVQYDELDALFTQFVLNSNVTG